MIAIIGVLVALLLPAVQAAREAARRTSCTNNLKQLALAMLNFHDTKNHLPTSVRPSGSTSLPRIGLGTLMLPYFEEQNLYNLYDTTQNWSCPTAVAPKAIPNAQLVGTVIPTWLCPSVPMDASQRLDGDSQWTTAPQNYPNWSASQCAAPTDYSPICGVGAPLLGANPPLVDAVQDATGLAPRNVIAKLKDCRDGTSSTIMLAEVAGRPYVYQNGNQIANLPDHRVNGGGWARAASDIDLYGSSANGTTYPGPCGINCTNGFDVYALTNGQSASPSAFPYPSPFGSNGTGQPYAFHTSGANFAFGDGSVHFLDQTLDIRVLARLVTRRGNEVVSNGDFLQ